MDRIAQLKADLADDRIKHGVDYAIVYKYGQLHIRCCEVWKDAILFAADKLGLEIHDLHTYPSNQ